MYLVVDCTRVAPRSIFRRRQPSSGLDVHVERGDNIAISCSNGQYVVAEGGGYGGAVNCNRTVAAQWETFGINPWP